MSLRTEGERTVPNLSLSESTDLMPNEQIEM